MAIQSYPRVTIQGTGNVNNPQNGFGMMVWNTSTLRYELLTAQTFASIANQANQSNQLTAANLANSNFTASTNNGVLVDTLLEVNLTGTLTTLPNTTCKYVTIYYTIDIDIQINGTGSIVKAKGTGTTPETIRLNRPNANQIAIAEGSGGTGLIFVVITS
jgi:hypothetical protein